MGLFQDALSKLRREVTIYKRALQDPRTPRRAKVAVAAAAAYAVSPFDIIPDWVPVLGQLDDVVVVTFLLKRARRLIPDDVYDEHRRAVEAELAAGDGAA